MINMLLLGLLTGIDNFFVSAGIGTTRLTRRQIIALVVAFAAAETLMPLAGFSLVKLVTPELLDGLGPTLLILAGFLVILRLILGAPKISTWFLFTVPVIMALDNLAAGAGLGAIGDYTIGAAMIAGLTAATLSLAGFVLGLGLVRSLPVIRSPAVAQAVIAICLVSVGVFELVAEV